MFCTLGASGRLIQIPDGAPFVCPLCGKVLASPTLPRQDRLKFATFFSIGVGIAVFIAFFGGALLGVRLFPGPLPSMELLATRRLAQPPPQFRFNALVALPPIQWAPLAHRKRAR
jgi:hypothetical protein